MEIEKPMFYNKTTTSIICGIVAIICLIFIIADKIFGNFLNEAIVLAMLFIGSYFFIASIVNYAFYIDNVFIKILFNTIYWKDVTRIEISKKTSNISIYHLGKRTEINFFKYFLLTSIVFAISIFFAFLYGMNIKINTIGDFIFVLSISILFLFWYIMWHRPKTFSFTDWNPEYTKDIITAIILSSEMYSFTEKEEIICGENKIVLTNPNTDKKE